MEVNKWKQRRLVPKWGDNDQEQEPCVVVFAPPSVGWMARWRELAIKAPELDPEKVAEDGYLERVTEWSSSIQQFRSDLIADLVLRVASLTLDGKAGKGKSGKGKSLDVG